MPLYPGDKLGPYEILAPIGAGGMGEVYKARAVASLNHPNICSLFDIGPGYMVMELVDGETLAVRIAKGALPLDQALKYAAQIADALDRAHRAGVTHRDVKPQNIMVTRDGVKILDFGLAKSQSAKPGPTEATLTRVLTTEGTVMGTPQYMAPELFEGREADARADIWAFGAVLYEMVTGRKAFEGKSYSSLVGAILATDPAPMAIAPFTPSWLERLVRRCLAKDPEERYHCMRYIVLDLRSPPPESASPAASRKPQLPWAIVAGAMTLVAMGVSAMYFTQKPPMAQSVKLQLQTPGTAPTQFLALSPDGRMLAFIANTGPADQLWVRSMDSLEARLLTGTDGATYPFWSPDGAWLGYFAHGQLSKIAVAGGPPQKLCATGEGRGGTWNRDGVILFSGGADSPILRVPTAGGVPTPVTTVGKDDLGGHLTPVFLPDGDHFLYRYDGLNVGVLKGGTPVRVLPELRGNVLYVPSSVSSGSGYLLFRREETLMAQSFDPASLNVSGDAVAVAERVATGRDANNGVFSVSGTGTLVYGDGASSERQLSWIDRAGKRLGGVGKPDRYTNLALSPDEKSVAVSIRKSNDGADIWMGDLSRELMSRLTFREGQSLQPIWYPDGKSLVFGVRLRSAATDLYRKSLGGNSSEELLVHAGINGWAMGVSADAKWLLYESQSLTTGRDLWLLPLEGERKPVPYLQTPFNERYGRFSPDAKWIAYQSDESGRPELYVQAVPASGAKYQISTAGGTMPEWRRDGKELYYLSPDRKLMAVPIKNGAAIEAGKPQSLFALGGLQAFTPSRDGQRFLVIESVGGEKAAQVPPVTVVLNWQADLKK